MKEIFFKEYKKQLESAVSNFPDKYVYGLSEVPSVCEKMNAAFIRGSFNKDGIAIKNTCKSLGIKYTYAGIKDFLEKGE